MNEIEVTDELERLRAENEALRKEHEAALHFANFRDGWGDSESQDDWAEAHRAAQALLDGKEPKLK